MDASDMDSSSSSSIESDGMTNELSESGDGSSEHEFYDTDEEDSSFDEDSDESIISIDESSESSERSESSESSERSESSKSWDHNRRRYSTSGSDVSFHNSIHKGEVPFAYESVSDCDSDDSDESKPCLTTTLVSAFKLKRLASILNANNNGADVSYRMSAAPVSLLHYAVKFGSTQAVSALLRAGADPNLLYKDRSALMFAVLMRRHEPEIAKALLEAGAHVNFRYQKSIRKRTLLHRAALLGAGKRRILELLLDYGADVNTRDDVGESVLCCAAKDEHIRSVNIYFKNEYVSCLELLISRGAEMFHDGPGGEDSSFEAVLRYGPPEAVKVFLNDNVKLENFRDRPLLHLPLATSAFGETIEFLLDSHVFDIEMRNSYCRTVLHEAMKISLNHSDIKLILRYGADPNALDGFGQPPVLVALFGDSGMKTLWKLLDHGARLDSYTLNKIMLNHENNLCNMDGLRYIVAHLALFEGQDCNVVADVDEFIDVCGLKLYYKRCKDEVLRLKNSLVYDKFTYHNILVSRNVYRIVGNVIVEVAVTLEIVSRMFPIYGRRIHRYFPLLQEKLRALKGLGYLIGFDVDAFHHIYHSILLNLRRVDLQNLGKILDMVK